MGSILMDRLGEEYGQEEKKKKTDRPAENEGKTSGKERPGKTGPPEKQEDAENPGEEKRFAKRKWGRKDRETEEDGSGQTEVIHYGAEDQADVGPEQEDQAEEDGYQEKDRVSISEEDVRELEKLNTYESETETEKRKKKQKRKETAGYSILSVICAYLVILIYGVFVTDFSYSSSTGQIEPEVFTVSELQERSEFNDLLAYYVSARSVYEKILVLDWQVQQKKSNVMEIGAEYHEKIDDIDKAASQLKGSSLSSKYTQIGKMLDSFLETHLVSYCDYMSMALSTNDAEAADQALAARETAESLFQTTTQNVLALGSSIKGVDLAGIEEWSPTVYIQKEVLGLSDEDIAAQNTSSQDTVDADAKAGQ